MVDDDRREPLRALISPQLPELGQYLVNISFNPPPPIPLFVPSLVQRRGHLRDPFRTGDWGVARLGRSGFPAKEVGFHRDRRNAWEGFPVFPVARAGFMTVAQVDGAGNTRVQAHYLVIIGGIVDCISHNPECG